MFSSNTSFVPSPVGSKHNHGKSKYEWDNLDFEDDDSVNDYETSIDDILVPFEPIEDSWTPPTFETSPPYASLTVSGLNVRSHSPVAVPAKKEFLSKSFQKEPVVKRSFHIAKKEAKHAVEDKLLLELLDTAIKNAKKQSDIKAEWSDVARKMKTPRTAKQCRDRWQNYLRPGIQKGNWTADEEQQIVELYSQMGP
eukprot:scaffold1068_cov167-Amphora_coffeaeformis.AAC.1